MKQRTLHEESQIRWHLQHNFIPSLRIPVMAWLMKLCNDLNEGKIEADDYVHECSIKTVSEVLSDYAIELTERV